VKANESDCGFDQYQTQLNSEGGPWLCLKISGSGMWQHDAVLAVYRCCMRSQEKMSDVADEHG